MSTQRDELFRQAIELWGSFWRFAPTPGEVKTLHDEMKGWPTLAPLTGALRHATETLDERPSVAWLIREGRKRLPERVTDTATLCPECLDDGWRNDAKPGEHPMLRPCPECRPLQAELWASNAYKLDAPAMTPKGDGNPEAQSIVDRHRSGGSPLGRRVLIAREPAMTPDTREYYQGLVRANVLVGSARRERYEYLRRMARRLLVELPNLPVGDEEAVRGAVELLRGRGAVIDQAVIDIPTPEQYLAGATITRAPVNLTTEAPVATHLLGAPPRPAESDPYGTHDPDLY